MNLTCKIQQLENNLDTYSYKNMFNRKQILISGLALHT